MNTLSRMVALSLAVLFVASAFAGCNTVKGVGKDIQRGGEAIEDAAE